ncbi:MAG: hypothetical protein R2867_37990 [Caldilineaceae bacterium]
MALADFRHNDWRTHPALSHANCPSPNTQHAALSLFPLVPPHLARWYLVLYYIAVLDRGAFNVRYSSFVTPPAYLLLGMALGHCACGDLPGRRAWIPADCVVPAIRADLYDSRFARRYLAT